MLFKLSPLAYLELFAAVLLITSTWLQAKEKIISWCIAIISLIVNIFILYTCTLYAQCITSFVELGISFYGWYLWQRRDVDKKMVISTISRKYFFYILTLALACSLFLDYLQHIFCLNISAIDIYYIIFVFIAEWLIIRKKIEGWILCIFLDIFCIVLFYHKGIYIYSFLYCIYVICSVYGFITWKKFVENKRKSAYRTI